MKGLRFGILLMLCSVALVACDSGSDEESVVDGDQDAAEDGDLGTDGDDLLDGDETPDGDAEAEPEIEGDGDVDGDVDSEGEGEIEYVKQEGLGAPPLPPDQLNHAIPEREPAGEAPTAQEIQDFTRKTMAFFKDTGYWDWVYRTNHGLDASYDEDMMPYRLWWQDVHMRRDGDVVTFKHVGRAENICKRTIKVLSNAAAGYLLTGDERMAEVAADLMRGMVALSLGIEFEREDPIVKYLQSRAVFNHNHSYTVDERQVSIDYSPMYTPSFKWNVHVFNIPDNPEYGDIWISNMRSKDDVAYMYHVLPIATRVYHLAEDANLKAAAELFIEYMRGFSQSIVDNGWYILTKYEDGEAVIAYDATKESHPPADLGSYVHWEELFGPDAECTAQLGAALAGYGYPADRGDCDGGLAGWSFESFSTSVHYFNYNIYNYFHIAALATAQLWGYDDIAASLMNGLVFRFDELMYNPEMPNMDDKEADSDMAGWLLKAATHGYPLTAEEARHIMQWYGESSDWYRQWPHWDPWASLGEGEELSDYKAPRVENVDDGEGGAWPKSYVRLVEMPYVFEYCESPIRSEATPFIDCDIVADPEQWVEE